MVIKATSLRSRVLMISEMEDQQYKLNHYLPFSTGACQKCSNFIRGEESYRLYFLKHWSIKSSSWVAVAKLFLYPFWMSGNRGSSRFYWRYSLVCISSVHTVLWDRRQPTVDCIISSTWLQPCLKTHAMSLFLSQLECLRPPSIFMDTWYLVSKAETQDLTPSIIQRFLSYHVCVTGVAKLIGDRENCR